MDTETIQRLAANQPPFAPRLERLLTVLAKVSHVDTETIQRLAADQPPLAPRPERLLTVLAKLSGLCDACEAWLMGLPNSPGQAPGAELAEVLARCPDCCGLAAVLDAPPVAAAEGPEPGFDASRLSFLRPRPIADPWERRLTSRLLGAAPGLSFVCDLGYARGLLQPLARLRADAGATEWWPQPVTLLDATQQIGSARVQVCLQAQATLEADTVALFYQVESPEAGPAAGQILLRWGLGQPLVAPLEAGGMRPLGLLALGAAPTAPESAKARVELLISGWE